MNKSLPIQIGNENTWQSISAGTLSSVAIKTNQTLWGWGDNVSNVPVQIGVDSDWQIISSGSNNNFAIKANGTLWTWSAVSPFPIQIGTDSNWKTISSNLGLNHAIKTNGTLWGWGSNYYGGIGDGTIIDQTNPVQIGIESDWDKMSNGEQCGFAIKTNGTLWAWGWNSDGQLGDGTTINKLAPIQLGTDTDWSMISTKYHFTMALKNNSALWRWGSWNSNSIPTQLGTENNWSKITTGGDALALVLKSNNTLWDFSQNPIPPTQISCTFLNNINLVEEKKYVVYPNPVKNMLNINTKSTIEVHTITIYNQLGQVMLVIPNAKNLNSIDVSSFKIGNYFLKITSEKGNSTEKFIKE